MKGICHICFLVTLVLGSDEVSVNLEPGKDLIIGGHVTVTSDKEYLIKVPSSDPVRIYSEVILKDKQHPLIFMIRTDLAVKSWRIPSKNSVNSTEHASTLCSGAADKGFMKLIISTNSKVDQEYKVVVSLNDPESIRIQPGRKNSKTTQISPTTQQLFQFDFSKHTEDMFLLTVISKHENPVCSLVSVQPLENCQDQIYDEEKDMRYGENTVYQTMLRVTAIVIEKTMYPQGVNIVLLSKSSNSGCYQKTEPNGVPLNRSMEVTISIEKLSADPVVSTCIILAIYIVLVFFAGGFSFFTFRKFGFEFDGKFGKHELRLEHKANIKQLHKSVPLTLNMAKFASMLRSRRNSANKISTESEEVDGTYFEQNLYDTVQSPPTEESLEMTSPLRIDHQCLSGEESSIKSPKKNEIKVRLEAATPRKFFWQTSLPTDETDIASPKHRTTQNLLYNDVMRSRHSSGTTQTTGVKVKKIVTLDLTEILIKRANRDEVTVADMAVHHNTEYFPDFLRLRSELFLWLIMLAGIYYTLPVFQLVYYYQETAIRSGNLDTCYYNYLCLYPWGPFADYGHVFSNVGYVISGLFFMAIVKHRSYKYEKLCNNPKCTEKALGIYHPKFTGVPETYGIFYALGAALTFEGILSGCYHVCPTAENFQFDTTFMYVISVLVFLKVYQFRHSDITQTAHLVFLVIGLALIVEVIGIFTSSFVFWVIFVTGYITFVIIFIIQVYYNGTGPTLVQRIINVFKKVKSFVSGNCSEIQPQVLNKKLIPTLLILLCNIAMAVFFLYKRKPGVSRYILSIMMVNMVLYIIYYISNKLYYRFRTTNWIPSEGLRILTCLYGVASLLFMCGAVVFFIKELKTSAGTPAESRNLNDSCFYLIFDNHDMWHFLSAAGLFYLFMFILTVEDCNMAQPRNKMPVF